MLYSGTTSKVHCHGRHRESRAALPGCTSNGSVLQCVAVCCSVLQCVAIVCCNVLQCAAACCSLLQCDAKTHHHQGHCEWPQMALCCSVLQCVAACCSVVKCAAVCCSVLQCVAKTHHHQSHCESRVERPGCASDFLRPAVVLLAVPFDLIRC